MEVRPAKEGDIPAIVNLLKVSLGEQLMPKSERYWRWKHVENPFGDSPVLVCLSEQEVVGVRAFMRWEWWGNGRVYRAVRAVDTATHPDFQGKGIFKKLTLALVDHCKELGDDFIFNTPNQQSKPGYLKMGWQEVSRFPVTGSIQRPAHVVRNLLTKAPPSGKKISESPLKYFLDHPDLSTLLGMSRQIPALTTNVSAAYLRWRYLDVPVASYVAVGDEQDNKLRSLLIGRIKETRIGRELRITDFYCSEPSPNKYLVEQLHKVRKEWDIDYTTTSGTMHSKHRNVMGKFNWKAFVGPFVTIRNLNLVDLSIIQNFNQWLPSLGDLELF